jgi:hypothetical protein
MDNSPMITEPEDLTTLLESQARETEYCLGLDNLQALPVELGAGNPAFNGSRAVAIGDNSVSVYPNSPSNVNPAPTTGPTRNGLQPQTAYARDLVIKNFGVKNIGGYEYRNINGTNQLSDHALGLAIDIMVYKNQPLGNQIAAWAIQNRDALKIKYIIWYNQFASGKTGWRWESYVKHGPAANQRTATGRHEDHVHLSFLRS